MRSILLYLSLFYLGNFYAQNSPILTNDASNTTTGVPISVAAPGLLANDTEPDGQPLTVTQYQVNGVWYPANGVTNTFANFSLSISANGGYTITPIGGFVGGLPNITIEVSDNENPINTSTSILYSYIDSNIGGNKIGLAIKSCNQGYIQPSVNYPNGAYKIKYSLVVSNPRIAYGYDPVTALFNVQIFNDLEAIFGDPCILNIERGTIFQEDKGDGVGGTYPRPWLVNQPWDVNEFDASDVTPGNGGIFDLVASSGFVLYPRQFISADYCVYIDPNCGGRIFPTPSGSGINFDNIATATSTTDSDVGNLLITDFHTTNSFISADLKVDFGNGNGFTAMPVNFDGTYTYNSIITVTNDGNTLANDVNFNYGLGNFINDGVTFSSLNVTQLSGPTTIVNTNYNGNNDTYILAAGQTLSAGQTVVINVAHTVNPTGFFAYNFLNSIPISMTLGAVDGFNESSLAQLYLTSFVTWSDAMGSHVDRYENSNNFPATPSSDNQCLCENSAIKFPYEISLDLQKNMAGYSSASSGVAGNIDISFELTLTNINTSTVQLSDVTLTDDLIAAFGANFLNIVFPPTIVISTASVNPTINTNYNGNSDINIFDGISGIIDPGQSVTVFFTIEVNPSGFGTNTASFTGSDPLDLTVPSIASSLNINPPILPIVSISNDIVFEGSNLIFNVTLNTISPTPVVINLYTSDGSAGNFDYTPILTTITIPPNAIGPIAITVPTILDALIEPNEIMYINGVITGNSYNSVVLGVGTIINSIDTDNDGIPDNIDIDDDNDGILDTVEGGNDSDGDGIIDSLDLDSDNDGIPDIIEAGGIDLNGDGLIDDITITGTLINDINNDGLDDNIAISPLPNLDVDNDGLSNSIDLDSDNDGIADVIESFGIDNDGDGVADGYIDIDNDGFNDLIDSDNNNIVGTNDGGTPLFNGDMDLDNILNAYDLDSDNDGVLDVIEAGGIDNDGNGIIDSYSDIDNDGFSDNVDTDNNTIVGVGDGGTNLLIPNSDNSFYADYLDVDADNDGIIDNIEGQFTNSYIPPSGNDINTNGVDDQYDVLLGNSPIFPIDTDGDLIFDYIDNDSDNDCENDSLEGFDLNGDDILNGGENIFSNLDSDNDGLDNSYDLLFLTNITSFFNSGNTTLLPLSDGILSNIDSPILGDLDYRDLHDAGYSYPFDNYCTIDNDPTPTIIEIGGIFSFTVISGGPALSINTNSGIINLSNSDQGVYAIKYTTLGVCPFDSISTITINQTPEVQSIDNYTYCSNSLTNLITFTGTANTTYNWTNTNPNIGVTASGTGNILPFTTASTMTQLIASIIVTPTNDNCIGADSVFTITINPINNAVENNSICYNSNFTFADGVTHANIILNETYISYFTNQNGCDSIITTNILVNNLPPVFAGNDTSICKGASLTLNATAASSYSWNNNNSNPFFIQPNNTFTYSVTGIDNNGCSTTDEITVTVYEKPIIAIYTVDTLGCTPFNVNITNNSTSFNQSCLWDFGNGDTSTDCNNLSYTYENQGLFNIIYYVTSANGCTSSDTIFNILVEEQPESIFESDLTIVTTLNTEIEFQNYSSNSNSYSWFFNDASQPSTLENPIHFFPEIQNTYNVSLIVENEIGCSDTSYSKITVNDIILYFIPNSFTPDNDNINTSFKPIFTTGFDPNNYHLTIFNRWGEIVFESYNSQIGWDGSYTSNNKCMAGVYVWNIQFGELTTDKKHNINGTVTLLK